MPTYRGMDGTVSLAADLVGEVTQWAFSTEFEVLETTVVQNTHRTRRTGLADGSGSCTVRFDYGDLQQKTLLDTYMLAKPDGAIPEVRLWFDNDPKYLQAAIVLTTFAITSALGAIVEATISFMTTGPYSIVWS